MSQNKVLHKVPKYDYLVEQDVIMKKILVISLTIFTFSVQGQKVELSDNQFNINIAPLTASYERKIDENKSFTLSGGIAYGARFESSSDGGAEGTFIAVPFMDGSFRNYYKRKRIKKDNLRNNSGNYFGLYTSYSFDALGEPSSLNELTAHLENSKVFTIGPVWGFQRNYASGIHFGLSIGPGYTMGEYIESDFTFVGGLEFGFVLNSK